MHLIESYKPATKDEHGVWVAKSVVVLDPSKPTRRLTIRTRRSYQGALITRAQTSTIDGRMEIFEMARDYSVAIAVTYPPRCTAAVVDKQHDAALARLPLIIAEVEQHEAANTQQAVAA